MTCRPSRLSVARFNVRKLRYLAGLTFRVGARRPIVVFTFGKVGSTTVLETLRRHAPRRAVLHVHAVTPHAVAAGEAPYRSGRAGGRPANAWRGIYVRWRWRLGRSPREVVTIVRDPVARNVSAVFQVNPAYRIFDEAMLERRDPEEMTEAFLDRFHEHDGPLTWYADEFRTAVGVDVFAAPPPRAGRPSILETGGARVLVMRLEDLDATGGAAIGEFLGLGPLALVTSNRSDGKFYGPAYRHYVDSLALPTEYLDRMYASRFARHFYSAAEIERFRSRWRGRGSPSQPAGRS